MKTLKNCDLHEIDYEYWNNFKAKGCKDLSDFDAWALKKAFKHVGLENTKGRNCWYWDNGKLVHEVYKGDQPKELWEMFLTDNNILLVNWYAMIDCDWEHGKMYRIEIYL